MASIARWKRQLNHRLLLEPAVQEVLSREKIEAHCRQTGYGWRRTFWSPATTLLTFLLQVLSAEKTLRAAVAALLTQRAAGGATDRPSPDPSAYGQARRRLPGAAVTTLNRALSDRLQDVVGPEYRWHGHPVHVVDGSTASMPDTPSLQQAFPQPPGQQPGCGFPVVRLVVLFCWATGAVTHAALGDLRTAEVALFRKNWDEWLAPGDVVVADRHYGSYVDLVRLLPRGVFGVFRLHQRRPADFRRGQRLGRDDPLVTWSRPAYCSCGKRPARTGATSIA